MTRRPKVSNRKTRLLHRSVFSQGLIHEALLKESLVENWRLMPNLMIAFKKLLASKKWDREKRCSLKMCNEEKERAWVEW